MKIKTIEIYTVLVYTKDGKQHFLKDNRKSCAPYSICDEFETNVLFTTDSLVYAMSEARRLPGNMCSYCRDVIDYDKTEVAKIKIEYSIETLKNGE